MSIQRQTPPTESECWRVASAFNYCLAKIVGKFAGYPQVDPAAFHRMHEAIGRGLASRRRAARIGDFCQALRGIVACPIEELIGPPETDAVDIRLASIAQVVREGASLEHGLFEDLIRGLLSWNRTDKQVILRTLSSILQR
jgi:hypothetical protein